MATPKPIKKSQTKKVPVKKVPASPIVPEKLSYGPNNVMDVAKRFEKENPRVSTVNEFNGSRAVINHSVGLRMEGAPVAPPPKTGRDWDWDATAKAIAPYASNIINSFRKPPKPSSPRLDSEIGASHVSMDNDRHMVERGIRADNLSADRSLDENTARAVRGSNVATRATQLSGISAAETNTNVQIDNQARQVNAAIRANNNNKMDAFADKNIDRTLAIQREASANIANASDKFVSIENEKAKNDLDLQKYGLLKKQDAMRETMERGFADLKIDKEYRAKYGEKKAKGGYIKTFKTKRMASVLK